LECNGFFLEQLEEIAEKTWDIASSRAGSWYIDPMPPAFMFTSFNPTQRWPKEKIHDRYLNGTLPSDFFYQTALPKDNPFVTQDQWNTWGQMGDRYQKQFIEGDWTDFDDTDPKWVYEFDEVKHVMDNIPYLPAFPVKLGWDFNREPLTCVAMQMSPDIGDRNSFTHFIKEFHGDMQIRELCMHIKSTFPSAILEITGDSSGNKGDVGFENRNETHYTLIKRYLNINDKMMRLNSSNLEHHDSRLLVNTALSVLPNVKFSKQGVPKLISEYKYAKVDTEHNRPGHLLKDRKETNGNKLDLFDGSRYLWQTYYRKYIEKLLV
jgi:phage terminase large subunit